LDLKQIREHWDLLAKMYGIGVMSTTKTPTIKALEIDAIARSLSLISTSMSDLKEVLEVGCGNGHNIYGLAQLFPKLKFVGLDYSNKMISAAQKIGLQSALPNVNFAVADVLNLAKHQDLEEKFDVVFTDRLLINLNTWDLQKKGLSELNKCVKHNGFLLLIENFTTSYLNQNQLRNALNLDNRTPDPYNLFLNEDKLESFLKNKLKLSFVFSDNFGSLHDLLLYVLLPHLNNGRVVYDSPIMNSVTQLLLNFPNNLQKNFGNFGQNKLYLFRKNL
jgi:ubiquinone/menaquinone biosynthesis C-methylase UbiE